MDAEYKLIENQIQSACTRSIVDGIPYNEQQSWDIIAGHAVMAIISQTRRLTPDAQPALRRQMHDEALTFVAHSMHGMPEHERQYAAKELFDYVLRQEPTDLAYLVRSTYASDGLERARDIFAGIPENLIQNYATREL